MSQNRQHAGLSPERWSEFSFDDQVLMIANEMNRASQLLESEQWEHVRRCYERVLRLVDLTVGCAASRSRRRESLRWRDLVAMLYLQDRPAAAAHEAAFRCLLRFTPTASRQLGSLFPTSQS